MGIDDFSKSHKINSHMRSRDIAACSEAAKFYEVYILVRRTNTQSIQYIGRPGYVAKRLDCKAKTADFSVRLPEGFKEVAGLVVDPTLEGFHRAFNPGKLIEAKEEWKKFKPLVAPDMLTPHGKAAYTYMPKGKFYAVQLDKKNKHYGCVMFSSSSLLSAANYIHGDYDLYDIVPADNPKENIVYEGMRLDVPHNRGKRFFDVQHFLNRRMGAPLVLHGSQSKWKSHTDEPIDFFCPNGEVREAININQIQELYQTVFMGRQPHGAN